MSVNNHYFFCGIGGSGMLPLALLLRSQGRTVAGSDRALDQGRTSDKFEFLESLGIELFPQDGSGLTHENQVLVASAAVEDHVPDVQAANKLGLSRMTRAELLAQLFNAAKESVAIGGTSGKSTTTGMIGWILHEAGLAPTIVNGAVMKNFVDEASPFSSSVSGSADLFVSEVDESDGSIALFEPSIAVLNNIALDHKSMEELRKLFGDFMRVSQVSVVNADNDEVRALCADNQGLDFVTFGLENDQAHVSADQIVPRRDGIAFQVLDRRSGQSVSVDLPMPGRHNVANALAAMTAALVCGVPLEASSSALEGFQGIRRRMEFVGTASGVTVIDDFAHNPDKIAATLRTLRAFPGRLLVYFQPHGYGPLRLLKDDLVECFSAGMNSDDLLFMPEPVYYGGTVERTVTSADVVALLIANNVSAEVAGSREDSAVLLAERAEPGDRIVIMGARDDTLSEFAEDILARLEQKG